MTFDELATKITGLSLTQRARQVRLYDVDDDSTLDITELLIAGERDIENFAIGDAFLMTSNRTDLGQIREPY
jgi:hypothetical protein